MVGTNVTALQPNIAFIFVDKSLKSFHTQYADLKQEDTALLFFYEFKAN